MAPPAGTALWHFRRTQEAWRKAFDTLLTWVQFCISEQINRVSVSLRSPELSSRDYPASSWRALTAWATPVLSTVCGGEDRKLTAAVKGERRKWHSQQQSPGPSPRDLRSPASTFSSFVESWDSYFDSCFLISTSSSLSGFFWFWNRKSNVLKQLICICGQLSVQLGLSAREPA